MLLSGLVWPWPERAPGVEPPIEPTQQDGYLLEWLSVSTNAMVNFETQQTSLTMRLIAQFTEPPDARTIGYTLDLTDVETPDGRQLIPTAHERRWSGQTPRQSVTWVRGHQRSPFQLTISPRIEFSMPERLKALRGNLYVLAAHETETIDIPLKLGARLPHDVPGLSFELIKVERKDQALNIHFKYGRPGTGTLFHSGAAPVVLGNELIDADAQPTGHRQSGSSMSGQEGRFNYRLEKDGPEPAFLRLELATELREQVINFDLRDVPVLPGAPPVVNAQDDGEPEGGHPREAMPKANQSGRIKATGHDDGTDQ